LIAQTPILYYYICFIKHCPETPFNIFYKKKNMGLTDGKSSTNEGGGEDHEVTVSGPPKVVGPRLLHHHYLLHHS
jgi:hypothetical protein